MQTEFPNRRMPVNAHARRPPRAHLPPSLCYSKRLAPPPAHVARRAFSRFGKGRHRAGLNYGDCFSYALATVLGEPLLYKGDDFPHTDITPFATIGGGGGEEA